MTVYPNPVGPVPRPGRTSGALAAQERDSVYSTAFEAGGPQPDPPAPRPVSGQLWPLARVVNVLQADTDAPSTPAGLTVTPSDSLNTVSWNANSEPDLGGYRLYRDGLQVYQGQAATFKDASLTNGQSYSYTVSAYDDAGNESASSAVIVGTPVAGLQAQNLVGHWRYNKMQNALPGSSAEKQFFDRAGTGGTIELSSDRSFDGNGVCYKVTRNNGGDTNCGYTESPPSTPTYMRARVWLPSGHGISSVVLSFEGGSTSVKDIDPALVDQWQEIISSASSGAFCVLRVQAVAGSVFYLDDLETFVGGAFLPHDPDYPLFRVRDESAAAHHGLVGLNATRLASAGRPSAQGLIDGASVVPGVVSGAADLSFIGVYKVATSNYVWLGGAAADGNGINGPHTLRRNGTGVEHLSQNIASLGIFSIPSDINVLDWHVFSFRYKASTGKRNIRIGGQVLVDDTTGQAFPNGVLSVGVSAYSFVERGSGTILSAAAWNTYLSDSAVAAQEAILKASAEAALGSAVQG